MIDKTRADPLASISILAVHVFTKDEPATGSRQWLRSLSPFKPSKCKPTKRQRRLIAPQQTNAGTTTSLHGQVRASPNSIARFLLCLQACPPGLGTRVSSLFTGGQLSMKGLWQRPGIIILSEVKSTTFSPFWF